MAEGGGFRLLKGVSTTVLWCRQCLVVVETLYYTAQDTHSLGPTYPPSSFPMRGVRLEDSSSNIGTLNTGK